MLELKAIVTGRVQAVSFRVTTCTTAIQLGLKGIVRNKNDGSVEIIAQGEEAALRQLIQKLKSIFDADFVTEFSDPGQIYPDFSVGF